MFYICTIVMPFTVLQCVNKDIIIIFTLSVFLTLENLLIFSQDKYF